MNQPLRKHLDLLKPDITSHVRMQQSNQKVHHNKLSKQRTFVVGDPVFVRNFSAGCKWLPGVIVECKGPLSFLVILNDGQTVRRHIDHIRTRTVDPPAELSIEDELPDISVTTRVENTPAAGPGNSTQL